MLNHQYFMSKISLYTLSQKTNLDFIVERVHQCQDRCFQRSVPAGIEEATAQQLGISPFEGI